MDKPSGKNIFHYSDVVHEDDGTLTVGGIKGVPDISKAAIGELAAWFLGPRAENQDVLREMITLAVDKVVAYRLEFEPDDPSVITEDIKQTPAYKAAVSNMIDAYSSLLRFLQRYTTPYFSMRYQAHMLWDNTLPALAAYFATMLHNPNNVTIQASSATTPLEILVGWDLCGMIGFPVSKKVHQQEYNPWGHVTCDGSVANIEACWTGREVKFLPFALRRMLTTLTKFNVTADKDHPDVVYINNLAHPVILTSSDGISFSLVDDSVDSWQLFNIPMDEILLLPQRIAESYGITDEFVIWSAVVPFSLNYVGWVNMMRYINQQWPGAEMPVLLAPSTMHYSVPKAAAVAGYGFGSLLTDNGISGGSLVNIAVDEYARMDMAELEKVLQLCYEKRIPVVQLVGVAGSTEEGAVDPLDEILRKRNAYRDCGLEFFVHADAAWGGYMITGMRKPYTLGESIECAEKNPDLPPYEMSDLFVEAGDSPLSDYVHSQFAAIKECDSVTIDPHKMGYVQYPAGAILYRNGILRRLTTFTGAYIGGTGSVNPGAEPTVGIFGLEGSKPGAAAAAVFMNHRVIRPDVTGHGKIIRQCMENTKLFALYLMALSEQSSHYRVTLLCDCGTDTSMTYSYNPLQMHQEQIVSLLGSDEIRNFGPDLNILDYVFTPLDRDGEIRLSVQELNAFNTTIYDQFHVPVSEKEGVELPVPIEKFPGYFLTKTIFHEKEYGSHFLDRFVNRIYGNNTNHEQGKFDAIVCLRSVVMDPFMPYAVNGDFFRTIIEHIDTTVSRLVMDWRNKASV